MWTKHLKTRFLHSPDIDADRVIYTAIVILNGFWERKRFIVLPEVQSKGSPSEIIFPKLPYHTIPNFWQESRKLSYSIPVRCPPSLLSTIKDILPNRAVDVSKIEHEWQKVEMSFWNWMKVVDPKFLKLFNALEIRVSLYGSIASFEKISNKTMQIVVRSDADVSHIAESILTSKYFLQKQGHAYTWEEVEAAVDLLMTDSYLRELFPSYKPTLKSLRTYRNNKLKKTQQYLAELHIIPKGKQLRWERGKLMLNEQQITQFSLREEMLLRHIYDNQDRITTFDEVADVLWGENEFKSLAALNKTVQRLRLKLIALGFDSSCIQTVRKRGYLGNL